jgi:hypothetical protein
MIDGGATDIGNMCRLCRYHHPEIRQTRLAGDHERRRRPRMVPPPFIGPDRKPLRNTAHHQRDLIFAA